MLPAKDLNVEKYSIPLYLCQGLMSSDNVKTGESKSLEGNDTENYDWERRCAPCSRQKTTFDKKRWPKIL
jgi:hypothetical protein